jgi:hypothetical protein
LTAHPAWIGEFVKRAHKSVSSRIEFGSVREQQERTAEPHIFGQRRGRATDQ